MEQTGNSSDANTLPLDNGFNCN